MRVLVTGGSGFVGRHVLHALAAHDVTAPTRHKGSTPHYALGDEAGLEPMLAAIRPEAIFHLAAQASVAASFVDPLGSWRANLLGSVALAEAALAMVPAARFILASSAEVYGLSFQAGTALDETAAFVPANPYAASKAAIDLATAEMALRGLQVLRLRLFNMAGPGQSEAFVIASFCRQIARIEAGLQPPLLRVGALDRWRDFLDVRDAARAMALALEAPWSSGTALNIASGNPRRIGDVLQVLLRMARRECDVEVEPTRLRPIDVERVQGNAARALSALGWAPTIPWTQTLAETLDDWRSRVQCRGDLEPA
jgi:nucleoside-diphosphate-sugar epimerase